MTDLARRLAEGLQEFLGRAEEFVNQEEALRAFRGTEEVSRENPMTKKKSKQRVVPVGKGVTKRRPVKKVEDYNWTPINAPAKEVLMEIKKDPDYKDPPPIFIPSFSSMFFFPNWICFYCFSSIHGLHSLFWSSASRLYMHIKNLFMRMNLRLSSPIFVHSRRIWLRCSF